MKNLMFILVAGLFSFQARAGQPAPREKAIIMKFLSYISGPKWDIDTVTSKYVVFYAQESKVASRMKRKFYLGMAVSELADEVGKVNLKELIVTAYNDADQKLQIMTLGPDFRRRSFVVTDPAGKFVRYFLIKDDRIESFVLFQKKAYLLLN